jgi:predicted TIM-barrel fold metal-dependent hydrolase
MAALEGGYISADGHFVEPADLWVKRMDKRFRDRAPQVESRADADWYAIDGVTPFPVGLEGASMEDKIGGGVKMMGGHRHADTRPGAWDPKARLADLTLDHIRAEVMYPGGFGLQFWAAPDAEYQRECCRVYNDWVSEFCSVAPERFLGGALVPMRGPIEGCVAEAQRAAGLKGIRTLSIPTTMVDRPYARPDYEPLWAALQEIGQPVSIHIGTTGEPVYDRFLKLGIGPGVVDAKIITGMRAVAELIWAGVPQRYPKLRFIIAEGGIGWIPSLVGFMDHWWTDHRRWMEPKLEEKPSFYFDRQFWATFEEDRGGVVLAREGILNIDRMMWGSDYPHTEGTFPHSQEAIARDFAGLSETQVYKLVAGNAARLYGLN